MGRKFSTFFIDFFDQTTLFFALLLIDTSTQVQHYFLNVFMTSKSFFPKFLFTDLNFLFLFSQVCLVD